MLNRIALLQDVTVRRGDVLAAWSGIRPLVKDPAGLGKSGTQGREST